MPSTLEKKLEKHKTKIIILVLALVILDAVVWWNIVADAASDDLRLHFLDVGQGDSELIALPGDVQMLVDGGPPAGRVLAALGDILSPTDRYIDLVVLSHAETDHFGGLIEVLKRYRVGAFIWNGRSGTARAFQDLMRAVEDSGARVVVLGAGDAIRYGTSRIDVLSPTPALLAGTIVNDTAFTLRLASEGATALFTGDIGPKVEELLAPLLRHIDVLKVAHHGSKFSSTQGFLDAVRPALAVIEVGKNSYGHPTPDVLARLAAVGARVFRTDRDGTVEVVADGEGLRVFTQ